MRIKFFENDYTKKQPFDIMYKQNRVSNGRVNSTPLLW